MPEPFTVRRDGGAPLAFEGEHLAGVSGQNIMGQDRNRWYELDLYRTAGGQYVVSIHYHSLWQGETSRSESFVCISPPDVAATLQNYDPLDHVAGYPPGDIYAEKQARLERLIEKDYQYLIGELFRDLGDEFAERID